MTQWQTPQVVFQPATYCGMQKGIHQIVEAIRPTLGPRARLVAIERFPNGTSPELLDNGGVIARRIIELPDRDENMGAMFIRGLLWRLHEQIGDGTATAAVLFQAVYDRGLRYIASGGSAKRLRHYLETGMRAILDALAGMTLRLEGKEQLAQVAKTVCYDQPLANMLGEIFDIIGEYGWLEIQSGRGRGLEREYIEGIYWEGGVLSRQMIADHAKLRTQMEDVAILISDLEIEDPQQLIPIMDMALRAGIRSLLIVARRLSDGAIGLLLANGDPAKFQSIAVKTPGLRADEQAAAMEDLAILTGGRPVLRAAGDGLSGVQLGDLGRARRVWADHSYFGLVGGQGDPRRLRDHIATVRTSFQQAADPDWRKRLQQRLGKLMGGSATLRVGGDTETESAVRKELAERTANALRGAVLEGVLPGGGVALLACRSQLQQMLDQSTDPDERAAYRILIHAMEAPTRTIVTNAGYDAGKIVAEIERAGSSHRYGFDVESGQVVDMLQAGIFDPATIPKSAVRCAIAGAALALTTEVLVHRKRPKVSLTP